MGSRLAGEVLGGGEGKGMTAKRRKIRVVAERDGCQRQLAWIDYNPRTGDVYAGLGRVPFHISRHESGRKHFAKENTLDLPVIPMVTLWQDTNLRDLRKSGMGLKEQFGAYIFLLNDASWVEYPLFEEATDLILYSADGIIYLTLEFWLADVWNKDFVGWPNKPERVDEVTIQDNILLVIAGTSEKEPITPNESSDVQ